MTEQNDLFGPSYTPEGWKPEQWRRVHAAVEGGEYREDFLRWMAENREIWLAFIRMARTAREMHQRARFSARAILQVLRWNTAMRDVDSAYKINNNFAADLSRLAMALHPSLARLFATRKRRGLR